MASVASPQEGQETHKWSSGVCVTPVEDTWKDSLSEVRTKGSIIVEEHEQTSSEQWGHLQEQWIRSIMIINLLNFNQTALVPTQCSSPISHFQVYIYSVPIYLYMPVRHAVFAHLFESLK